MQIRSFRWAVNDFVQTVSVTLILAVLAAVSLYLFEARNFAEALGRNPLKQVGEGQSAEAGTIVYIVGPIVRSLDSGPPADMPLLPDEADSALSLLDCPVQEDDGACRRWIAPKMEILGWRLEAGVFPKVYRQKDKYLATRRDRLLFWMSDDTDYTIVAEVGSDGRSLVPYADGLGISSTAAIVVPGKSDATAFLEQELAVNRAIAAGWAFVAIALALILGRLRKDRQGRTFLASFGPSLRRLPIFSAPLLLAFVLPNFLAGPVTYAVLIVLAIGAWGIMLLMAKFR